MKRVYMRQVGLVVVVAALIVPHWAEALRLPGQQPISFVVGLSLAVAVLMRWAIRKNRAEPQGERP